MLYRLLGTLIGIVFAVFLFLFVLKVDTSKKHSKPVSGEVESISEGPSSDILISFRNNPTVYYINRGIESGLNVDSLSRSLIGDTITIWVGGQLIGTPRHITHIDHDEIFFSEW